MAKYDVMMSCGHTQTIQLFGKMEDRRKKIAWLENHGLCTECAKKETERNHAEATAKAAAKAVVDNLPELTGTEKQVNWALTIRAKILAEVDKKIEDNKSRMDAEILAKSELQAKAIKKVLAKFTEARFWIDNRNSCAQQVIRENKLADEIKNEIANLTMIDAIDEICTADAVDASVTAMQDLTAVYGKQPDDNNAVDCDADDTTVKIKVDTTAKTNKNIVVATSKDFVNYKGYLDFEPVGIDDTIELLDVKIGEGCNPHISKLYKVPANDIWDDGFTVIFTYGYNPFDGGKLYFPGDFQTSTCIKDFDDVRDDPMHWFAEDELIYVDYGGKRIDYSKFLAEDYGYDD